MFRSTILHVLLCITLVMTSNSLFGQTELTTRNAKEVSKSADVVEIYYQSLFKTRDFKTISEIITADAIYYQAEGLPYGGTYTGFNEWITMFTNASTYFDLQIEKEPTYFTDASKEIIVIHFTIKCTAKKSGNVLSMPISEEFTVKNGKIISIRPFYFDTKKFSEFLN